MEMPQVYRPVPRRAFDFTPTSSNSSISTTPLPESSSSDLLSDRRQDSSSLPARTRSILNLTSSTLLGIYSKTATDGQREESSTPWGTGSQTPSLSHRPSLSDDAAPDLLSARLNSETQKLRTVMKRRRKGSRNYYIPLILQNTMLILFGIGFGMMVTHLQQTQQIAPVPVPSIARTSWYYQVSWGLLGVVIGNALPKIDEMLNDEEAVVEADMDFQRTGIVRSRSNMSDMNDHDRRSLADSGTEPFWHSAVRSIGAFVGIAFAVRKVPWQSTLQVSLTLAVANPVLWYLIDRSKSGLALSSIVGVVGTFMLLLVNPDFVPVPAIHHDQVTEKFGVYTWLASILFCTSLCFGAIGRRLQL